MIVVVETVSNLPLTYNGASRGQGVHASSIIRCLATESGFLKPEYCEELSLIDVRDMSNIGIVAQLRIHMGLAWEDHYIPLLPDVAKHPGEMFCAGIYMNHDGESLDVIITQKNPVYRIRIHEVKVTYKSINTVEGRDRLSPLTLEFMWLAQMKAYCKGAGTRFADLHVLYVCGDYSYPIQPVLKIYHVEFTQREVDDNWDLMTSYMLQRLLIEGER